MSRTKQAKKRLFDWFRGFKVKPAVFELWRDEDPKGISGTGHVLDGVVFPDGTTVVRWRRKNKRSTAIFNTFRTFEEVHIKHHGRATIRWVDGFDGFTFTNSFLHATVKELQITKDEVDVRHKEGIGIAQGIIKAKINEIAITRDDPDNGTYTDEAR